MHSGELKIQQITKNNAKLPSMQWAKKSNYLG